MKKILRFTHRPGRHCASTSLRDLMEYHNINFSEPMCFGIGQGLGIWYLKDIPDSPTVLFHVRSHDLESVFFNNLSIPFLWETYKDPKKSTQALIEKIDLNLPVLIQTDIYYLPYFNSSTHFPGHSIVVWGYDTKEETFVVSDTEREKPIEVKFQDLEKAMFFDGFFKAQGNQFAPHKIKLPDNLDEVIKRAIYQNSLEILKTKLPYSGICGLDMWISELRDWDGFSDWKWCARFAYQIIEKRGTGGGGFRLMYSEFLEEASHCLPILKKKRLPDLMYEIGIKWRKLAYKLKEMSERPEPNFKELKSPLKEVQELEYRYHMEVVDTLDTSISKV